MYEFHHEHRVRYRESDPMGIVYHAHYVDYFEAARTEALRAAGLAYKSLEDAGIIMPVIELSVAYKRPAFYDDVLLIRTRMALSSSHTRVRFEYDVFRKGEQPILVLGHVTLCFCRAGDRRPIRAPESVVSVMTSLDAVSTD